MREAVLTGAHHSRVIGRRLWWEELAESALKISTRPSTRVDSSDFVVAVISGVPFRMFGANSHLWYMFAGSLWGKFAKFPHVGRLVAG